MKEHGYNVRIKWTGNGELGNTDYTSYSRNHEITAPDKTTLISASSDPYFRGDKTKFNPEELLVSSISSCHMLWYLHLCSSAGVIVVGYEDEATGTMVQNAEGSGQFAEVILHPTVTVTKESMIEKAKELHHKAHEMCFIARSCNFTIRQNASILVQES